MRLAAAAVLCLAGIAMLTVAADLPAPALIDPETAAAQWKEYQADGPKTIVELQPFRSTQSVEFENSGDRGSATLINLNPRVNAWFLLTLRMGVGRGSLFYHLENPRPDAQTLALSAAGGGLLISADGRDLECELWRNGQVSALQQAQRSKLPYAPICADRLYLRNAVAGSYTHLERVTNFLRDHVWGGEKIVGFVKQEFFRDAFLEKDEAGRASMPEPRSVSAGAPAPAQLGATIARRAVYPEHLGIDVGQGNAGLFLGQWYPVRDIAGMFVSVIQPQAIAARVSPLESR
jgi:hypothetical protein